MAACIIVDAGNVREESSNYVSENLIFQDWNITEQATGLLTLSPGISYSRNEITAEICYRADDMSNTYSRVFETAGLSFGLSKSSGDLGQNADYTINPFFTAEPSGDEIKEPIDNLCFGDVHTFTVRRVQGLSTGYLDGITIGTFSSTTTSFNSPSIYFMQGSVTGRITQGTWFNVRIYDRSLSNAEILQNYNEDVRLYR